ncbi:TPA: hypothetical protein ACG72F_004280 [Klebsiella pneumoniae]|nr:hypothetical protein [Klebsiella pneumoniae]
MSILTKEGIQKILNDDWLLMDDCEGLENCTVIKELARMALAAMDSEPVAEVLSSRPGNDTSTIDRALPVGTQLYRHAQQPVVPESVTPAMAVAGGDVFVKSEQVSEYPTDAARNIYRAMLAAAQQEGK